MAIKIFGITIGKKKKETTTIVNISPGTISSTAPILGDTPTGYVSSQAIPQNKQTVVSYTSHSGGGGNGSRTTSVTPSQSFVEISKPRTSTSITATPKTSIASSSQKYIASLEMGASYKGKDAFFITSKEAGASGSDIYYGDSSQIKGRGFLGNIKGTFSNDFTRGLSSKTESLADTYLGGSMKASKSEIARAESFNKYQPINFASEKLLDFGDVISTKTGASNIPIIGKIKIPRSEAKFLLTSSFLFSGFEQAGAFRTTTSAYKALPKNINVGFAGVKQAKQGDIIRTDVLFKTSQGKIGSARSLSKIESITDTGFQTSNSISRGIIGVPKYSKGLGKFQLGKVQEFVGKGNAFTTPKDMIFSLNPYGGKLVQTNIGAVRGTTITSKAGQPLISSYFKIPTGLKTGLSKGAVKQNYIGSSLAFENQGRTFAFGKIVTANKDVISSAGVLRNIKTADIVGGSNVIGKGKLISKSAFTSAQADILSAVAPKAITIKPFTTATSITSTIGNINKPVQQSAYTGLGLYERTPSQSFGSMEVLSFKTQQIQPVKLSFGVAQPTKQRTKMASVFKQNSIQQTFQASGVKSNQLQKTAVIQLPRLKQSQKNEFGGFSFSPVDFGFRGRILPFAMPSGMNIFGKGKAKTNRKFKRTPSYLGLYGKGLGIKIPKFSLELEKTGLVSRAYIGNVKLGNLGPFPIKTKKRKKR